MKSRSHQSMPEELEDASEDSEAGDAEHSPEPAVDESNPWVTMSGGVRYFCLGALAIYTAVCVVGSLLYASENPATPLLALSDLIYLGVFAVPLLVFDRERDGWFHPMVFATVYAMVRQLPRRIDTFIHGLSAHTVLSGNEEHLTRLVAYENFLNALALACTFFGFYLIRSTWLPDIPLQPPRRLWPVIWGSAIISFVALILLVGLSGDFTQHILNLSLNQSAVVRDKEIDGTGQLVLPAQWFAWSLVMFLAYRPRVLRNPAFWAVSLVALAMVYLAAGKRSILIAPVGTAAVVWMLTNRRVPIVRMVLLLVGVFVTFSVLLLVRAAISGGAKNLDEVGARVSENLETAFTSQLDEVGTRGGSYSSVYPILEQVPSDSPLLWGETYLTILTRPIPRVLWPSKPRGTDFRAGVTFFNAVWGVPPGPVAEAYWNFHIPGVIGVFFLWGVFNRWIYNVFLAYHEHGLVVFFYAFTLLVLTPTENTITGWMMTLIPTVLFGLATGILGRSAASDHHGV